MKYQIRKTYELPIQVDEGSERVTRKVIPYNAETTTKHKYAISWSHGFTHYEDAETGEPLGHCGTQWFEDNAI